MWKKGSARKRSKSVFKFQSNPTRDPPSSQQLVRDLFIFYSRSLREVIFPIAVPDPRQTRVSEKRVNG